MGIRPGEKREEGEGQSAGKADAAANLDPVVTLVMSLFLPPAVTDDRIAQTLRTAAEDLFGISRRPVEGWLAMIQWVGGGSKRAVAEKRLGAPFRAASDAVRCFYEVRLRVFLLATNGEHPGQYGSPLSNLWAVWGRYGR